ncbi:DNA replication terminus site-binding protein [Thalassotalea piscium]|uniref:DNA replication terminus site-binding protein n=1 Tax=Thalassotalea piscium TaxID=1230533 RepID=A0A7X0TVG1_9GAMM|nr:DNA replication terminus site-binding protein [Thalassotalea piscium]MBB6545129.1 hypothetical protein [Thalassotalea piscium]
MIDISDEKRCEQLMTSLKAKQISLTTLMTNNQKFCVGWQIEQILKTDEESVIKDGVQSLEVTPADDSIVLTAHQRYERALKLSTQFVERVPGLIVINGKKSEIIQLVAEINAIKDEILRIVNKDRPEFYQRHEFIHRVFPRIMTDQLRRHIHIIDTPVTNAWFNWVSRPVPSTMTIEQAISYLQEMSDKPKALFTTIEWKAMLQANIAQLRTGQFSSVQYPKALKLLPIMTYQTVNSNGVCRATKNANIPFILIAQPDGQLPIFSRLESYIKKTDNLRKTRVGKNKTLLNSYLKLIGVHHD